MGIEAMINACGFNSPSLWLSSRDLHRFGVVVPKTPISTKTIEEKINKMFSIYPVMGGRKALGCAVLESQNMRGEPNMRGYHLIGDDESISSLWAALIRNQAQVKGFHVTQNSMCWTGMIPDSVFIPYLDFDEKGLGEKDFTSILRTRIMSSINLLQDIFEKILGHVPAYQMFFNKRELGDGLMKYSVHVHWYQLGIENINLWKGLLGNLEDLPRKLLWSQVEGKWGVVSDTKPLVDLAVYGGRRQLFRGPYSGKHGDDNCILMPVFPEYDTKSEEWSLRVHHTPEIFDYIMRSRISSSKVGLHIVDLIDHIPPQLSYHASHVPLSSAILGESNGKMWDFFSPIVISAIIPAWQRFRYDFLLDCPSSRGASVPYKDVRIIRNQPHESKPGLRYLTVEGDTFCFMDSNHCHGSSRTAIGICVDLVHCVIQQTCFACKKWSEKYSFLHIGNNIRIETLSNSRDSNQEHFSPLTNEGHQFFLDYFPHLFRYHRITDVVWVYDENLRTWKNGARGNRIVGILLDRLNKKHFAYISAKKNITVKKQIASIPVNISREESDKMREKIHKEARKFLTKHNQLLRFSAPQRGKLLDDFKTYTCAGGEIAEFNPYPHLIPMKNGQCLNIFTFETEEIRPNHYFTGLLSAELLPSNHNETKEMDEWFLEVASGDVSKSLYLKQITAYCMTHLTHDRHWYTTKGNGKNGKGLHKQLLVDTLEGVEGCDPKWKCLQQKFWEKKPTGSENSEGASPEAFQLLHKTLAYSDDMDRVPINSGLVKSLVACEPRSARTLYGTPIQFKPSAKYLWTTNFFPDGPGNDPAYWERFILLIFGTKYTDNPEKVDKDKYILPMDQVRYMSLLGKKDGFITAAVIALYEFYKSLPWDNELKQPRQLSSIPIPESVKKSIMEARETQLPLATFIREYTVKADHPLSYVSVATLFHNYILYLENANERKLKAECTQSNFVRLLSSALDIESTSTSVIGIKLIKEVIASKDRGYPTISGDAVL
jgi:hypothetical protein